MRRRTLFCLGFLLVTVVAAAQQPKASDVWAPWQFLVGSWTAEGGGEPGKGTGAFRFAFEVQGKILVRRSHLDFPATPARAAFSHEDLLIIYPESGTSPNRAIYFDSEGFVIHYIASFSEGGKLLTFLSDASPDAPRERLTYRQNEDGTLKVKFEIAPPGQPEAFTTHVEGVAHRVGKL